MKESSQQHWCGVECGSHNFCGIDCSFLLCRTLLQLSALCQRTYQCSNVVRCLFQLLEEKLSLLLQDTDHTDPTRCPDHLLLQWLVLLLSHILASLSLPNQSQNRSNLFVPVLSLPVVGVGQGEGREAEGSVVVDSRAELGEMRREMKRRLTELQHQMKLLVGEEKMALRHEYEAIIQVGGWVWGGGGWGGVCVCVCAHTFMYLSLENSSKLPMYPSPPPPPPSLSRITVLSGSCTPNINHRGGSRGQQPLGNQSPHPLHHPRTPSQ